MCLINELKFHCKFEVKLGRKNSSKIEVNFLLHGKRWWINSNNEVYNYINKHSVIDVYTDGSQAVNGMSIRPVQLTSVNSIK